MSTTSAPTQRRRLSEYIRKNPCFTFSIQQPKGFLVCKYERLHNCLPLCVCPIIVIIIFIIFIIIFIILITIIIYIFARVCVCLKESAD